MKLNIENGTVKQCPRCKHYDVLEYAFCVNCGADYVSVPVPLCGICKINSAELVSFLNDVLACNDCEQTLISYTH